MAARANIRTLRYATIGAHFNESKIVDPNTFPQPTIIANSQSPRKFDLDARLKTNAAPNYRTKPAKDEPAMVRSRQGGPNQ